MEPEKLTESLREWLAVTESLREIVPYASVPELLQYVEGVVASPVAASVLSQLLVRRAASDLPPAPAHNGAGRLRRNGGL